METGTPPSWGWPLVSPVRCSRRVQTSSVLVDGSSADNHKIVCGRNRASVQTSNHIDGILDLMRSKGKRDRQNRHHDVCHVTAETETANEEASSSVPLAAAVEAQGFQPVKVVLARFCG